MRYVLTIYLACYVMAASAQKYPEELVKHRATVNYADHYLTFFVHPLKTEVFPDPAKRYYWYSANDVRSTQGGFSGKLLNGAYSDFYKNKQLKEHGVFIKGLKAGNWRSWDDKGVLREDSGWKNGTLHGRSYKYNTSGKLTEQVNYRQGTLGGKRVIYGTGDSVSVSYFRKGKEYQPKLILLPVLRKLFRKKIEPGKSGNI